jgi:hypothetical protein
MIDKDSTHRLGCRSYEVFATVPVGVWGGDAQPSFVHKRSRLKCMIGTL